MKSYALVFFVALNFALFGCGGSGSDDKLSGVWRGQLVLVETDPAGCSTVATRDDEYVVTRDDTQVTVEVSGGVTMIGTPQSDNAFEVTFDAGSGLSPTSFTLSFHDIKKDSALAEFSSFQGAFSQDGGLDFCSAKWRGEVLRQEN